MLIFARVSAFFAVMPAFSWTMIPMRVRLSMAFVVSVFFAYIIPPGELITSNWVDASFMMAGEIITGLGIGLATRFIFSALQQGIVIGTQQMGFMDAGIIDPSSRDRMRPVSMIFTLMFVVVFFSIEGHHLLLRLVRNSFASFPLGTTPEAGSLAKGLIEAGSMMMVMALKLAAPLLAGFLILGVVLGIAARVMPEINILMASLPFRIYIGLTLSVMMIDTLEQFAATVYQWIDINLII